jgi:outer membrane protein assembly factor BamB
MKNGRVSPPNLARLDFARRPASPARRAAAFAFAATLALPLHTPSALADAPADAWPVYRADAAQTGIAGSTLPDRPALLWKYEIGDATGAAATIRDGVVFIGAENGKLVALSLADGTLKWEQKRADAFVAAPTLHGDRLYIGDDAGRVYAFEAETGREIWTYDTNGGVHAAVIVTRRNRAGAASQPAESTDAPPPTLAAPPADDDALILAASYDGGLYAFNNAGELQWRYFAQDKLHGTPAIVGEYLFTAGCDGYVHCLRTRDGGLLGKGEIGAPTASSAAIAGSRLFVGSYGNQVMALDFNLSLAPKLTITPPPPLDSAPPSIADSTQNPPQSDDPSQSSARANDDAAESQPAGPALFRKAWTFENPDRQYPFMTSAATDGKRVIIGGRDKRVWCLDAATGRPLWNFAARRRIETPAAIVGDRAFVGADDGIVYALKLENGEAVWQYETGAAITAAPVIADQRMVVGNASGTVFCFGAQR